MEEPDHYFDDGPIVPDLAPDHRVMRQPRLILGGIYSSQDIQWNLEISGNTLRKWMQMGLKPFQSKANYFLADDILQYWRNRPETEAA